MLIRPKRWLLVSIALAIGLLATPGGLADVSAAVAPPPDVTGLWQNRTDKSSPAWQLKTSNGGQTLTATWSGGAGHSGLRGSFTGTLDQSGGTNIYRGPLHITEAGTDFTGTMSFEVTSANEVLMSYQQDTGPHAENAPFDRIPPPVFAKRVTADPVSGQVLVQLPGTNQFVSAAQARSLPVGSIIDTRRGRVHLTASDGHGGILSSDFFSGQFKLLQPARLKGIVELDLFGGNFKSCPTAGRAAAKPKSIRKLWGEGSGKFRTAGRSATATIRGTTWLTNDRCDGTQVRVTIGSVTVRDLVRKRNVIVTAPGSYLAPARKR